MIKALVQYLLTLILLTWLTGMVYTLFGVRPGTYDPIGRMDGPNGPFFM